MVFGFFISNYLIELSLNNYILYFIYLNKCINIKYLKINELLEGSQNLTSNNLLCIIVSHV
jgi:hypothetical protein